MEIKKGYSKEFLILANAIPFVGVLFFDWSLFIVIFLFWSENLIIGFFNIFKILGAHGKISSSVLGKKGDSNNIGEAINLLSGAPLAIFFCFHYGMFTFVHGIFVFSLFGSVDDLSIKIIPGVVALFLSHFYSFLVNFYGRGEYKKLTREAVMGAPYKRVVVLHLTIIFGGFAVMALKEPVFALLILLVIKTIVDLNAHKKEHKL